MLKKHVNIYYRFLFLSSNLISKLTFLPLDNNSRKDEVGGRGVGDMCGGGTNAKMVQLWIIIIKTIEFPLLLV